MLLTHSAVPACFKACSAVELDVNAVQWDVYWICAAVVGMDFEAKNELKQYLAG